ncbi:uncharacterized protein [Henckelia pumila]|uniref:uncharacterized protein n=1 Tax=Henckelia pumila TaxID=405737 RepID=UPI003C6E8FEF
MDSSTTVNSFLKPPVLDGTNYALWKTRMRFTIKAMDVRAWQSILTGWTPPKILDPEGEYILKPESTWTTEEAQSSSYNAKEINAIFSTVDMRMFGLIADCTISKDAWEALQEHCEGTENVRRTRLRFLNTKFENLGLNEDETIADYDKRLREIATKAFALGGPISNESMVNKVLRSLPDGFNEKIWVLEKVKDSSNMKLTELISIIQVFEMNSTS